MQLVVVGQEEGSQKKIKNKKKEEGSPLAEPLGQG